MQKGVLISAVVVLVTLVGFALGPRVVIDESIYQARLPRDLSSYIDSSEQQFPDLVLGTERKIVWRQEPGARTSLSIVFIHGFSASRAELSPLCDTLASILRANLYYARLSGHGRSGRALAEASVNDWLNDVVESVEIGKRIGDMVILIGNSTGATLVSWFLTSQNTDNIVASILLSPNFGPKDSRAKMLLLPWGLQIAEMFVGKNHSWEPHNRDQARFWTTEYPTEALLPMIGLVDLVSRQDFSQITSPILVLYSRRDSVVDPLRIEARFKEVGSLRKQLVSLETSDPSHHILAGQILSPQTTDNVVAVIESYLAVALSDPNWLFAGV